MLDLRIDGQPHYSTFLNDCLIAIESRVETYLVIEKKYELAANKLCDFLFSFTIELGLSFFGALDKLNI